MVIGCNIGPHPGHVRSAGDAAEYLAIARAELLHLAQELFDLADFFVVNLSSPNTPGLRQLLQGENLSSGLLQPLRDLLRRLEAAVHRPHPTPLFVKLPPEDADRVPWTPPTLEAVVRPLIDDDACDGFVAVNTSAHLARELGEDSGGVSGAPLRALALRTVSILRQIIGDRLLILGSGGIMVPNDASAFVEAGSDLVEIYSGLVYRGPGLLGACASGQRARSKAVPPLRRGGPGGWGRRASACGARSTSDPLSRSHRVRWTNPRKPADSEPPSSPPLAPPSQGGDRR